MKKIMIIGGTDSSGGAGLTRDTSTARSLGFDVMPVVTAVTAQTNARVRGAKVMPADFVAMQIEAALAADDPAAIKIGMLGTGEIAKTVARAISDLSIPVVIDPVLKSSSGGQLMSGQLPRQLLSRACLVTPNLPEAAALADRPMAATDDQIAAQAEWFLAEGARAVLIKGGHAKGDTAIDHLFEPFGKHVFRAPRLETSMRGTGCALATAIACALAEGRDLPLACQQAKAFVHGKLCQASRY